MLHYLIHAYDDAVHASLGLRPAMTYAQVAPAAPHALHMPSHIFFQLGMWRRAAASDEDAYQAGEAWIARKQLSKEHREFHSLSWLTYTYLQLGQKEKSEWTVQVARDTADELGMDRISGYRDGIQAIYLINAGSAADPAYASASELGGDLSGARASVALAVGLASAEAGEADRARRALERLRKLHDAEEDDRDRTAHEVMVLSVEGRLAVAEGETEAGLEPLRQAADLEAAMDPSFAGPPTPAKPAPELYGEMLLEAGRPAEAARQFERTLLSRANRARSLLGAARAAARQGLADEARERYGALAEIWSGAEAEYPGVSEVRAALGSNDP